MSKIPMLEKFAAQSLVEHDGELIFSKEKFAELIVKDITASQRELAKIMSDAGSEDQAYILRITASNIERKFGVEE